VSGVVDVLTLKGRIACELTCTTDELILCEALCVGLLQPLSVAEITGLLSMFVSKGKVPKEGLQLSPSLQAAHDTLMTLAHKLASLQSEAGILSDDVETHMHMTLNTAMMGAAVSWAAGDSFADACKLTALAEGDIVRILLRVEEIAKEVRLAARLLGDARLADQLDAVLASIKRDIVCAPSLYTEPIDGL